MSDPAEARDATLDEGAATLRQVEAVLEELAGGSGFQQEVATEWIRATRSVLREIARTAGTGTANVRDGIDRALALVREVEERCPSEGASDAIETLRAQLGRTRDGVRLQDDATARQLGHASGLLMELEAAVERLGTARGSPPGA